MFKKANFKKILGIGLALAGILMISGSAFDASAQGDPFAKPRVKVTRPATPKAPTATTTTVAPKPEKPAKPVKVGPPAPTVEKAPSIEERIAYYKVLRERAAATGAPLPKVTSVLTLDEISVNGVFKNKRGFSAMVEALPIKLSYTVYPGEKFFDGQLVAIDDNALVFRRVVKMSNGKFIASEENKVIRKFSVQEEIQGASMGEATAKGEQKAEQQNSQPATQAATQPQQQEKPKNTAPAVIVSPLEAMEKSAAEPAKDAAKDTKAKNQKKPVKVSNAKKPAAKKS